MAALALVFPVPVTRKKTSIGQKSTAQPKTPVRRFQGDAQWQRDFARWVKISVERDQHLKNCRDLRDHGVFAEAKEELAMSYEDNELAELLERALKDLR